MDSSTLTNMPQHIAIIMDGSRRWAKENNKSKKSGHNAGALAVRKTIEFAVNYQIHSLSLYAFSKENWTRPQSEIDHLMHLFMRVLKNNRKFLAKNNVKLLPIGDLNQFSPELQQALQELTDYTKNNTGLNLNVCLNYSGQWDIANACAQIALNNLDQLSDYFKTSNKEHFSVEQILEQINLVKANYIDRDQLAKIINEHVCCADQPPIDLIIRTSNEKRLSNFFLWQSAYSEFIFIKEYWPEFNHNIFLQCLEEFNQRNRRFGGV